MFSKLLKRDKHHDHDEKPSGSDTPSRPGITLTLPDGGPEKDILERQATLGRRSHSTRQRIRRSIFGQKDEHEVLPGDTDVDAEAKWEEKATVLAKTLTTNGPGMHASKHNSNLDLSIDDQIQEAINLHMDNRLEESFRIFKELANPNGANHPLAQVLVGLSLRHAWGCPKDPREAVKYLQLAASNAATVEDMALKAGNKKGGKAKGDLTMAMYELANCYRNGWGMEKDPKEAFKFYLMAANMGDADAKAETAWCLETGFGTKKDKFAAAQFYRAAEKLTGKPAVGNSWIWKSKYDPKPNPGQDSTPPKK